MELSSHNIVSTVPEYTIQITKEGKILTMVHTYNQTAWKDMHKGIRSGAHILELSNGCPVVHKAHSPGGKSCLVPETELYWSALGRGIEQNLCLCGPTCLTMAVYHGSYKNLIVVRSMRLDVPAVLQ